MMTKWFYLHDVSVSVSPLFSGETVYIVIISSMLSCLSYVVHTRGFLTRQNQKNHDAKGLMKIH